MTEKKEKTSLQILKERVGPVPDELQERVKEHARIKGKITKALKEGPKTVPEIAAAIGVPRPAVFWHVMSMKKYGKIVEGEQDGDYLRYVLVEKKK
jgi:predicted transcriptional regulator